MLAKKLIKVLQKLPPNAVVEGDIDPNTKYTLLYYVPDPNSPDKRKVIAWFA